MKIPGRRCCLLLVAVALNGLNATRAFSGEKEIGTGRPGRKIEPMKNATAASENVIEILTLDIKPGRRDEFHKVYETQSLPLLKKWNFNVVAYGPSFHDANSYYVIRAFKSLEDRQKSEDSFYGSDDWKRGPRDTIMGLVDHFAYAVVSTEMWKKIGMSDL
jgi:hypothetical protein